MKDVDLKHFPSVKYAGAVMIAVLLMTFAPSVVDAQPKDLFTEIRGKWGGNGTLTLRDGTKERLACSSQYGGSATQLSLIISCRSKVNPITMNAKLSANSGKLLGTWEEKTYKAIGTISGVATENKIKFYIGGNVLGTMTVKYSKRTQDVTIKASNVSLQDVRIRMTRR